MYFVNENIEIPWAVPAIFDRSNIKQYVKKCSSVVICMAASEHLHFRQVCAAHEITVLYLLSYSSAYQGQGLASVFASYPIPFKLVQWSSLLMFQ